MTEQKVKLTDKERVSLKKQTKSAILRLDKADQEEILKPYRKKYGAYS